MRYTSSKCAVRRRGANSGDLHRYWRHVGAIALLRLFPMRPLFVSMKTVVDENLSLNGDIGSASTTSRHDVVCSLAYWFVDAMLRSFQLCWHFVVVNSRYWHFGVTSISVLIFCLFQVVGLFLLRRLIPCTAVLNTSGPCLPCQISSSQFWMLYRSYFTRQSWRRRTILLGFHALKMQGAAC